MVANQAQVLLPEDLDPVLVFGPGDQVLRAMQDNLPGVRITTRGGIVTFQGNPGEARMGADLLSELITAARHGNPLSASAVTQALKLMSSQEALPVLHTKRKQIRAKTSGQESYLEAISNNRIVFGIGPAGTGKTYLAMAKAVEALESGAVSRIVLTRPAVEAGESLGFLPGNLTEKIDPYLRPLYDALRDMLEPAELAQLLESGTIEVAPLAYMRGRTISHAFIVLDEAQNTTPQQMKMFLTRLGEGSTMVVTGDITQIDLPRGKLSGLKDAKGVLTGVRDIEFCYLTSEDVVRDKLVGMIIDAYERAFASRDLREEQR
ncbi:PhoH family protein [uncultured Varibaculum sp.]|uniref:PhoH family protein n=1 Tax=uncultured Varibaculum sp. TaxID=413896 RepID=UPI0026770255|nr:PhoH family protein [uncultured Varibaculum sp.]